MKTLEEIRKIREEKRKELDLRVNLQAGTTEKHMEQVAPLLSLKTS